MADDKKTWYDIIKHKFPTRDNRGRVEDEVLTTVQGRGRAEQLVEAYEGDLTEEEKQQGWRCHYQEGNKPAGYRRPRKPRNKRLSPRR